MTQNTKLAQNLFWARENRIFEYWVAFWRPLHKNLHRPLFWAPKYHEKNRIFEYLGSLFGTAAQMGLDADWIGSHPEHHEPKGAPKFATHHPNFGHITYRVHLVIL